MAKKNKNRNRNRRRINKSRLSGVPPVQNNDESVFSDDDYVSTPRNIQSDPFVDHRGSRSMTSGRNGHRRASRRQLPLTDRNLQTLLEQNGANSGNSRYRQVTLDMDQFAQQQQQLRGSYGGGDMGDGNSVYSNDSRQLLLEFGELNPSLEHLSDLTSLDDVCFPDYYDYDGLVDADSAEIKHAWPDLSVLEEYIAEELDELHDVPNDNQEVNFHYPVARRVSAADMRQPGIPSRFDDILPTNEEAPLLQLVQVDEGGLLHLDSLSFRVRPKPIQPWEKSEEHVNQVLTHTGQPKKDALCRFTYFREDIEGTIHAPTLLGLISDRMAANGELITQNLQHLFSTSHGKTSILTREDTPVAEHPEVSVVDTTTLNGNPTLQVNKVASRSYPLKLASPAGASVPSFTGTAPGTRANSVSAQHHHQSPPFWLDILDPLEEEMKVLSKTFGLHPLTTEDIFLGETREKLEVFRQYYFVCFTSFDIVYERRKQRKKENEKKSGKMLEYNKSLDDLFFGQLSNALGKYWRKMFGKKAGEYTGRSSGRRSTGLSALSKNNKVRSGELCPLNMYMIIFKHGVLTFHFSATPHPINVRRRARMLKDHLTVSTDWICYALIDDITDSFAPMIDSIEAEVYLIEDQIMKMHSGDTDDSSSDDESLDEEAEFPGTRSFKRTATSDVFYRRQRSKSIVEPTVSRPVLRKKRGSHVDYSIGSKRSSSLSSTHSTLSKIVAWKRKGDMLRRIGECRKRVMSVMRLLGSKADVIKGFSKRFNDNESITTNATASTARLALRQEILMYLGDIQDHIVTMLQSLNHYEKLLARSHSNYLAQLNIDMTKVNNDMNDVLGKITILGTIVLPINVVTGLWGMNCIVPGQDHDGLVWFFGIVLGLTMFSFISYIYAKKVTGL